MNFHLYLPIAGNSVSVFLLVGLGGLVGFLSGLFGVGGGFLLTPLLIMIGIPPTIAAASDSNQIVAASTSGTIAHSRAGSVDYKMGILLLVGGILGGSVGVQFIKVLRHLGEADFVITVVYVIMLAGIGFYMFQDSLKGLTGSKLALELEPKPKRVSVYNRIMTSLPLQVSFTRSRITLSVFVPIFFGTLVGILAAIMGVGGGFIMVPVMVYLLRMPMHVVIGTSLFQILFTCLHVTIMQAALNHTVDFMLALLLLIGSVVGAQIGARISKRLKAEQLKILMSIIVLVVMVKMLLGLLVQPDVLVGYKGGH